MIIIMILNNFALINYVLHFFEKHLAVISTLQMVIILSFFKDDLIFCVDNSVLTDLIIAFSVFSIFLSKYISILCSLQNLKFIKIAKTSGAYQDLLKLIYKTIGWCVLSILVVIFSKIIDVNFFKIIALSICFGGLNAVLYATFLFKKLMNLAFLHN
mgnify:FL=1